MMLDDVLKEVADLPDFYGDVVTSVHHRASCGDTPLHAVVHWKKVRPVRLLLDAGADVNAVGEMGKTPLHYAVADENVPVIRLLIKRGARTDVRNDFGHTPLDIAKQRRLMKALAALESPVV